MKPKNFPERKRQRQLGALQRLKDQEERLDHAVDFYGRPKSAVRAINSTIRHLEDIISPVLLRSVRTKKQRGSVPKSSS